MIKRLSSQQDELVATSSDKDCDEMNEREYQTQSKGTDSLSYVRNAIMDNGNAVVQTSINHEQVNNEVLGKVCGCMIAPSVDNYVSYVC